MQFCDIIENVKILAELGFSGWLIWNQVNAVWCSSSMWCCHVSKEAFYWNDDAACH